MVREWIPFEVVLVRVQAPAHPVRPSGVVEEDMEDINPDDIIDMCVTKDGLALMYKSVCFHLDKWAGGHPHEQEALVQMKDNLLRIMLEQQFKKP